MGWIYLAMSVVFEITVAIFAGKAEVKTRFAF